MLQALVEDRRAFFTSVNGGGVRRNMGSIFDIGNKSIMEALVLLAEALDAAHLASNETMEDAEMIRGWFNAGLVPDDCWAV